MKLRHLYILLCCLLSLSMQSCDIYDQILDKLEKDSKEESSITGVMSAPRFSDDYRYFTVDVEVGHTTDFLDFNLDRNIELEFEQSIDELPSFISIRQPKLIKEINRLEEYIANSDKKYYIIVDKSLPQEDLHYIRTFLERTIYYFKDKVYLSYVGGHCPDDFEPCKNMNILENLHHVTDRRSILASVYNAIKALQSKPDDNAEIIVFSDGNAYEGENNEAIDPSHLMVENSLMDLIYEKKTNLPKVTYVNFPNSDNNIEDEAAILLRELVKKTDGTFFANKSEFPTTYCLLAVTDGLTKPVLSFVFENPVGKKFVGMVNTLRLCYKVDGEITTTASTKFRVGNVYNPIIVGGVPLSVNVLYYTLSAIIIFGIVYLLVFILIPYIMYKLWCKKNVITYSGANMAAGGNMLSEKCCYCKDTFKEGEKVVVNCRHTMHLECWEANGHKCTEHGYHNHESKYYYNKKNIFDPQNAPFYMNWILGGVIAGYIAYICYVLTESLNDGIVRSFVEWFFRLDLSVEENLRFVNIYTSSMFNMPEFGFWLWFVLVAYIEIMTSFFEKSLLKKAKFIFLKALYGGIIAYIIFFVYTLILAIYKVTALNFLLDSVPFFLTGIVSYYSYRTQKDRVSKKKRLIGFTVSILLSMVFIYLWIVASLSYHTVALHLMACMVFISGLGYTLAVERKKSRYYFLHVSGQIKEMEIAIYKLLRTGEKSSITFGRSVDCDIQISWDTEHVILPFMAEIVKTLSDQLEIEALEPGVALNGNPLELKKKKPIGHGDKFTIGSTTFTYVEKDL